MASRHLVAALAFASCFASILAISPSPGRQSPLLPTNSPARYQRLNFSSSAPLIFHSTFSLLQQWPNTFYPNGHTVAPCTIAKHTNLYHAHNNESFPDSPEWLSFDASMAYSILGGLPNSHLLTFRTTRDVKCLYFDGESASLMDDGCMDSQMLVIYNNSARVPENPRWSAPPTHPIDSETIAQVQHDAAPPPPAFKFNPLRGEYARAEALCNFIREKNLGGPGWGYEGIVRMNAAFELVWCNFTSPSAQLVSWLNVSAPRTDGIAEPWSPSIASDHHAPPTPPPRGRPRYGWFDQPFRGRSAYEWFLSAAKTFGFHGGLPGRGEGRITIDSCALFTFYDDALEDQTRARVESERLLLNLTVDGFWQTPTTGEARAAALDQLAHRRRALRATNVSVSDGLYMRSELQRRLRDTLSSPSKRCSNIDWTLVSQTIVADYSADIHELYSLLAETPSFENRTRVRDWLRGVRGLAHHLYMPYYAYPPTLGKDDLVPSLSPASAWSLAALRRCEAQHDVLPSDVALLSRSEMTTYRATRQVLSGICTILLPIFLSTELLWLQHFNNSTHTAEKLPASQQEEIVSITVENLHNLEELMAWLGWSEQWTTCSPGCEIDQVCAIAIWPVMGVGHFSGPEGRGRGGDRPRREEWLVPKCVDARHLW